MEYNYPETKELCLKFLTLVISVLVFSIAFSEKIIDFQNSTKNDKRVLIASWAFLIFSIITRGVGLTVHTMAGGQAVYGTVDTNISRLAGIAYIFIIMAGASFITGLILITVSGIRFLFRGKLPKEN